MMCSDPGENWKDVVSINTWFWHLIFPSSWVFILTFDGGNIDESLCVWSLQPFNLRDVEQCLLAFSLHLHVNKQSHCQFTSEHWGSCQNRPRGGYTNCWCLLVTTYFGLRMPLPHSNQLCLYLATWHQVDSKKIWAILGFPSAVSDEW